MRIVDDHIINPENDTVEIQVVDEKGAGGANHQYQVLIPDHSVVKINFQNGPIAEAGVNGLTQEVLLAIVIDRLRSFQNGSFFCRENQLALIAAEESLMWLQKRTLDRMKRDVEGKSIK